MFLVLKNVYFLQDTKFVKNNRDILGGAYINQDTDFGHNS